VRVHPAGVEETTDRRTTWTVGPAAALLGTTVRTLHHWDAIGLVRPRRRTPAGYRTDDEDDLDRLRQVLVWRELGFPLDQVAVLLGADERDRLARLRAQAVAVGARIVRLQQVRAALEEEVRAVSHGTRLTPEQKRELFGEEWLATEAERGAEAEQRWGQSDAWRQSRERTSRCSAADWRRLRDEGDAIEASFADLLRAGVAPDAPEAVAVAERARQHQCRWSYDTSPAAQAALGRMYVEDERFAAHDERRAAGLAAYVARAHEANADRRAGGG